MKPLTKETITKKIKQLNDARLDELKKYLARYKRQKNAWGIEHATRSIADFKPCTTDIKYFTRLNEFKESNGNLVFSPVEMTAYSYKWYKLACVFNGKMILNTYGYSSTTSKHVCSMRALFRQLGIKYAEIQAPQGLQCLESSLKKHVQLWASDIVAQKYARKKTGVSTSNKKAIKLLESLGQKFNEKMLTDAVILAEKNRRHNLDNNKKRKIERAEYLKQQEAARIERQAKWDAQQKTQLTLVSEAV